MRIVDDGARGGVGGVSFWDAGCARGWGALGV